MSANLERNVLGYIGLLISSMFPIYFLFLLFQNIVNDTRITGYGFIAFLGLLILTSLPFIILIFELSRQYSTEFTDIGLRRKVFGTTEIVLWDEVQNVTIKFFTLTLETDKKNYVINLILFKNHKEIVDFVMKNINNKAT